MAGWLTEDWRVANPRRLAQIRAMVLANDAAGCVGCCEALKGLDYLGQAGAMDRPVPCLGGAEDRGAAPEVMGAMAAATPGARHVVIPGAAHVANINAPGALNRAVAEFLGL